MLPATHNSTGSFLRYSCRGLARVMMLVLVLLTALTRPYGGSTLLAHEHHDRVLHLHISDPPSAVDHLAQWHTCEHGCEHAAPSPQERHPCTENSPEGLLVSIPDQDHTSSRNVGLSAAATHELISLPSTWLAWVAPVLWCAEGAPVVRLTVVSRRHCAPSTVERIIRTSSALLI
jgi:hypothetical protein